MPGQPRFHVFEPGQFERWAEVRPGDTVSAPGITAWNVQQVHLSDDDRHKKVYHLRGAPLLVLAIVPFGTLTGDSQDDEFTAHVLLSRHGILYFAWRLPKRG